MITKYKKRNEIIYFRSEKIFQIGWEFEMLQMQVESGLLHTDPNFNFTIANDLNITSEVIIKMQIVDADAYKNLCILETCLWAKLPILCDFSEKCLEVLKYANFL